MSISSEIDAFVSPAQRVRVARWGVLRLLRFCWLRVTGEHEQVEREFRLDGDQAAQTAFVETVLPVVIAFQDMMHREGLLQELRLLATEWFVGLHGRLRQIPAHESNGEGAWFDWAQAQASKSPFERLFSSVLRRISGNRPTRRAAVSRPLHAAPKHSACSRDGDGPATDLRTQQRRLRASGRRALVAELANWLITRIRERVPDPHAILAARRRAVEAAYDLAETSGEPEARFEQPACLDRFQKT
ncbi:MAG: hypothetical protein KDF64_15735 [Geminicoccaceae bacterium]|nr:hypothetical protein [Geminicoccaceae bacterium]